MNKNIKQILLQKNKRKITLDEKLTMLCQVLRNCMDLPQCDKTCFDGVDSFCGIGAFSFRVGIPKDKLAYKHINYDGFYKLGFTKNDLSNTCWIKNLRIKIPKELHISEPNKMLISSFITICNDQFNMNFEQIADEIEFSAGIIKPY